MSLHDDIDDYLLLYFISRQNGPISNQPDGEKNLPIVHSRYRKDFLKSLTQQDRQRCSGYIPRSALQHPLYSSFMQMYNANNDSSLIQCMGMDHHPFRYLLHKFTPLYDNFTPYTVSGKICLKSQDKRGRKRNFDATMCLGLVLMWTRSRGSVHTIGMIFGGFQWLSTLAI